MTKTTKEFTIANDCPECHYGGYNQIDSETTFTDGVVHIVIYFDCARCNTAWSQYIEARIGEIIENTVTTD